MFSVTSPALLLGLLCLTIPIAIHLFNKSRGRLVKVGSIELLRKLQTSQVKQIKIYRWLLLLLRLCIFTLVTLLIAGLWMNDNATAEHSRQVLVSPSWLKHAQQDELSDLFVVHKNDQIQLLGQNQQALTAAAIKDNYADLDAERQDERISNIWPLLNEQINDLRAEQALSIYITDEVEQTDFDSVALIKPVISNQHAPRIDWQIKPVTNKTANEFLTPFKVAIYQQDNRNTTALRSALAALQQHKIHSLAVSVITKEQLSSVQAEVLFYLADGSLPEYLNERIKQGLLVIKDEALFDQTLADQSSAGQTLTGQRLTNQHDKLVQQGRFEIVADTPLLADAVIYRYVSLPNQPAQSANPLNTAKQNGMHSKLQRKAALPAFWSLNIGEPLLTITRSGLGKLIEFSSRFEPQWFSLTKQAEFPSILVRLLSEHPQLKQYQSILIDQSQLQLAHNGVDKQSASNALATNTLAKQPLFHTLALLLAVFWLLERIISERYYRA